MAGHKLLLMETLLGLSLGEEPQMGIGDLSELIRACFLVVSSRSIDSCKAAERLGYETYEDNSTGTPSMMKGVAVPASGLLLREVVEGLMQLKELPEAVAKDLPDLSVEDFKAALYAIHCILYCLEWSEFDAQYEKRYPPEMQRRLVKKSLDSLESFRQTGEP